MADDEEDAEMDAIPSFIEFISSRCVCSFVPVCIKSARTSGVRLFGDSLLSVRFSGSCARSLLLIKWSRCSIVLWACVKLSGKLCVSVALSLFKAASFSD